MSRWPWVVALGCFACKGSPESPPPMTPPPVAPVVTAPVQQAQDFAVEGSLRVVTTKNETVEVLAEIEGLRGRLQVADVEAWTAIDGELSAPLRAWNSDNELRDERILETFFRAEEHPEARLLFAGIQDVDPAALRTEGSSALVLGQLAVAGGEIPVEARVRIVPLPGDAGGYRVESEEPVTLSIQALGLREQLAALVTLCGHQSVLDTVRVELSAVLKPDAPDRHVP